MQQRCDAAVNSEDDSRARTYRLDAFRIREAWHDLPSAVPANAINCGRRETSIALYTLVSHGYTFYAFFFVSRRDLLKPHVPIRVLRKRIACKLSRQCEVACMYCRIYLGIMSAANVWNGLHLSKNVFLSESQFWRSQPWRCKWQLIFNYWPRKTDVIFLWYFCQNAST